VVTRNGTPVPITRTEFRVLAALAARLGEAVPAADLLRAAWGDEFVSEVHYVRLYIGYLRSKLEDDPSHPRLIVTHRLQGIGSQGDDSKVAPMAMGRDCSRVDSPTPLNCSVRSSSLDAAIVGRKARQERP
jgi:DNA-binding winged helix-turn-helix (wHTH) protein